MERQRRLQRLELAGQLHVLSVVDRTVDYGHGVLGKRLFQRGDEVGGALHPIALGSEALGVLDEVGIIEGDVAGASEMPQLMPRNQSVLRIVPDQRDER